MKGEGGEAAGLLSRAGFDGLDAAGAQAGMRRVAADNGFPMPAAFAFLAQRMGDFEDLIL